MPEWIVIPNWDRFQHYKDRVPIWIKNYVELMSDDAYLGLTAHQRGVLHGLWLEYASSRCQLTVNTASLSRRLQVRVSTRTLNALNHAGFIQVSASKPLAGRYQAASPEESREEKEKKPPNPLTGKTTKPGGRKQTFVCGVGNCNLTWPSEERAAEHRENVHGINPNGSNREPVHAGIDFLEPEDAGPPNHEDDQ